VVNKKRKNGKIRSYKLPNVKSYGKIMRLQLFSEIRWICHDSTEVQNLSGTCPTGTNGLNSVRQICSVRLPSQVIFNLNIVRSNRGALSSNLCWIRTSHFSFLLVWNSVESDSRSTDTRAGQWQILANAYTFSTHHVNKSSNWSLQHCYCAVVLLTFLSRN